MAMHLSPGKGWSYNASMHMLLVVQAMKLQNSSSRGLPTVPRITVWCSEKLISFPDDFSHTEKKKSGNRTSDTSLVPRWDSSYGAWERGYGERVFRFHS